MPSGLGDDVRILEHILYNHYSSPKGFILDDNKMWNLRNMATKLSQDLDRRIKAYTTKHILVVFGNDFEF